MTRSIPPETDSRVLDLTPDGATESTSPCADRRRACKFILIEYGDIVHLVFGNVSAYRYHANLLHEFCERHGIASDWVHEPDLLEPLDSSMDVLGGGFLELDRTMKTATFSGASKAYGSYHWHQLEEIVSASPQFAGMTVRISR